jgi:hypothetical protein
MSLKRPATWPKSPDVDAPKTTMAGISITPMAPAMMAYSIAVAPPVSRKKSFARLFTFFIVATLHGATAAIFLDLNPDLFSEC